MQTRLFGDAAVELGLAAFVDHVGLNPTVIGAEPDGPQNGCDPRLGKVQFGALDLRLPYLGEWRLDRRVDPLGRDIGVDLGADAELMIFLIFYF